MGKISSINQYYSKQMLIVAIVFTLSGNNTSAQNAGSLFMLPGNYQTQLLNPSYYNTDAIIIALPGLSGFSFSNEANFSVTDLVYPASSEQMIYDFGRFAEKGRSNKRNSLYMSLPLFYLGIPTKQGMFSFYVKEHFSTASNLPVNTFAWIDNGNLPEAYHEFNSGEIHHNTFGFHEIGFGYAKKINRSVDFGIRGKILWGEMLMQTNNFEIDIRTSSNGDKLSVSMKGNAKASFPFAVLEDASGTFQSFDTENVLSNYLSPSNPGFGIDAGITYKLDKEKQFSASIVNLGLIFFQENSWNFSADSRFDFYGINISNSTNSKWSTPEFEHPFYVMTDLKDSMRNVFKPIIRAESIVKSLPLQTYLHYQQKYSTNLSVGITNHTVLQRAYILNTLSVNALKQLGSFSLIGNLSLHQLSSLTLGGGFQWKTNFIQLFFITDNLFAFYHPAAQKSYSVSFGLNFLIRKSQRVSEIKKTDYSRRGKISRYFPFYRKYK